ncbi:hypothetical protein [Kocuria palustris]|uniref:hypothetical protein n=1 Tax=Kocuria palustris TaxID=71999 RepID=UPI002300C6B1|nr:hypothetical protein [Kocuria palustris]
MLEGLAGLAGDAAQGGVEAILTWLAGVIVSGAMMALDWMGTWWLGIGSPDMGPESAAARIQDVTRPLLPIFGVIGTALGLVRFARDPGRDTTMSLVAAMIRTVVTVGIILTATSMLLESGTVLSPWLVDQIGQTEEQTISAAIGGDSLTESVKGDIALALIVMLLSFFALLAALVNAVMVLFSYGVAAIIAGILAFFAAMSTTETGEKAFNKLLSWLIAVILFKPVAAIIWGFGLAMAGAYRDSGAEGMDQLVGMMCGLVMICAAILALPAIARAVAPVTAAGPRGMGGAAAIGAIGGLASGAVLVGASAALGGAGAGAGAGASGAGGGAASAGAQGGASTAGAGFGEAANGTAAGGAATGGAASSGPGGAAGSAASSADGGAGLSGGGQGSGRSGSGAESGPTGAEDDATSSNSGGLSSGSPAGDSAEVGADAQPAGGAGAEQVQGSSAETTSGAGAQQSSGASADAEGTASSGEQAGPEAQGADGPASGASAGDRGAGQPIGPEAQGADGAASGASAGDGSEPGGTGADGAEPSHMPTATGSSGESGEGTSPNGSFVNRALREGRRQAMDSTRYGLRRSTDDFADSTETGEQ